MRLALLLSLVPALAFGQEQIGVTVQGQASQTVGKSTACGAKTEVEWTAASTGIPCSDLFVWAATAPCSDGPDAGTALGPSIPQSTWRTQGSGTIPVNIDDLPLFDGGVCGDAVDQTVNICATYSWATIDCSSLGGQQSLTTNPGATIRYDAVPPDAPTITAVNPRDGALGVRVTPPSDAVQVNVELRRQGDASFKPVATYSADEGGTTIDGLTNGTVYEVRASVTDEASNVGGFSAVKTGTPVQTAGFWATYVGDGGKETGGCAVGGGGLFGLLLLAGAALRSRRNR